MMAVQSRGVCSFPFLSQFECREQVNSVSKLSLSEYVTDSLLSSESFPHSLSGLGLDTVQADQPIGDK
jgi:hypothetical protein